MAQAFCVFVIVLMLANNIYTSHIKQSGTNLFTKQDSFLFSMQVKTDEGSGEHNASSPSNRPTLKEFVSQQLGAVSGLYNKLEQVGITDLKILIYIDKEDLNQLCQELGLPFGHKIKFKAAVRELQDEQPYISPNEQSEIDKIELALKQSIDLQQIFEAHFNQIDDQITSTKTQINTQIDAVIKSLQNRKKSLDGQLDEWKVQKLENINKEIANIVGYHNELKKSKISINDLLRTSGVSKRGKKIKEITNSIFENKQFKVFQDLKLLETFLANNTKLIGVTFDDVINTKEMQLFGALDTNLQNNLFNIASVLLSDVVTTKENERGYKVKLEWQFISNEEEKSNEFTVKYMMEEEEEKKDEMDWRILVNEATVQSEGNNKYSLDIAKYFEYDKIYQFEIQHLIEKPLNIIVSSNMKSITVAGKWLDLSKEQSISLNIHSHKGHESGYGPEIMLNSDNNNYASTLNEITDDWIIFEMKDGAMYYPTKLQVRARGTNKSSSGDPLALKRFRLKIGNSNCNEWIELNEQIFTASKTDTKLQTFNLDIVDNNNVNNRIVQKWKSIQSKNYKQFKLEILDNYGHVNYILIQEFKIFGVKM